MESHFNQRWYGTNQKGQHAFYIEVYSNNILEELCFDTSLPVELFSKPGITILLNKLCIKDISPVERNKVAEIMIEKIERIPDLHKYFFPDAVLDKNGKYCEEYASVLFEMKNNRTLQIFIPYSSFVNESVFHDLQNNFIYDELRKESVKLDKITFESLLNGKVELQNAYAEIYDENSEYYCHTSSDSAMSMEFYCVILNQCLAFVFFYPFRNFLCQDVVHAPWSLVL